MKSLSVIIQMKAIEPYFPVVLFIMHCKTVENLSEVKAVEMYFRLLLFLI